MGIGGVPLDDINTFIKKHRIQPSQDFCFLYGVQNLPTLLEDNHILRIKYLSEQLPGIALGFMDHVDGESQDALILPLLTLPLGISVIEKHLSLDSLLEIEDYTSALSPGRFREFVGLVRRFETSLGKCNMELTEKELCYKQRAAKIVVANRDISPNTDLNAEDISLKRVGIEVAENEKINSLGDVVGRQLKSGLKKNHPVLKNLLI